MIVFFGPAGAGKSVQGQILAARQGWRWLSAGQLLRDSRDLEMLRHMQAGHLVPAEDVNRIIADALRRANDVEKVILDGYPRNLEQARWLLENAADHPVELAIVLEVPKAELLKRLSLRGRADDTPEAIDERLRLYRAEIYPILEYLTGHGVNIAHIDGTGSVGQVHDRIIEELEAHGLNNGHTG